MTIENNTTTDTVLIILTPDFVFSDDGTTAEEYNRLNRTNLMKTELMRNAWSISLLLWNFFYQYLSRVRMNHQSRLLLFLTQLPLLLLWGIITHTFTNTSPPSIY